MNNFRLIKETLMYLQESRYSNILSPQGWGVRVEGIHASNPNNKIVSFMYTDVQDAYCVSDGLRMLVVPRCSEAFIKEDPNDVFLEVNGFNHNYRLEWHRFTIPTAYLEWVVERVQEFLYPFDPDVQQSRWSYYRLWWGNSRHVEILIAHPVFDKFLEDGTPSFAPYHRQPQVLLGGIVDDETDGEE